MVGPITKSLLVVAALLSGCAVPPTQWAVGPVTVNIAPQTSLRIPRHLAYLPAEDGIRLMSALGERPGAEVLGVVVTRTEAPPRMMIIFAKSYDERGKPQLEFVGWDDVPQVGGLIEQMLIARERR
jgi:hypothetical protein